MKQLPLADVSVPLGLLTACGAPSYPFEAVPVGVDDAEAEQGLEGDPARFECFTVEAYASSGDSDDRQLGPFRKTPRTADEGHDDPSSESDQDGD